jgi:hypothetical protein
MFWVFGHTALQYLTIQVNGTVISSNDIPEKGAPRYITEYAIRGPSGETTSYIAGPTDGSLPRSMPVGTTLRKQSWQVSYERDGQVIIDFPVSFYVGICIVALALMILSVSMWLRGR